jgi:cytochrome subunit of sulfide dehydrogenase
LANIVSFTTRIAAGTALLLLSGNSAAEDISEGSRIAATCASCHDPAGRVLGIPPIVTLDEQAIVKRMLDYRASESPSHVMHAVALSLSDEEVKAVARYLSEKADAGRQP